MLNALWIVIVRTAIIFAVMGVLFLAITILNKLARPNTKKGEER